MDIKPYAVMVLFAHIWYISLYYRIESLTTSITFVFLTSDFIWCRVSEEWYTLNSWYKCNLECNTMYYMTKAIIFLILYLKRKINQQNLWMELVTETSIFNKLTQLTAQKYFINVSHHESLISFKINIVLFFFSDITQNFS